MLTNIAHIIKLLINALSILVLSWGVLQTALRLFQSETQPKGLLHKLRDIQGSRAFLGSYILLSLELLIAADIIETITHPTNEDIIILIAIVLIRTFISYFLDKEIKEASHDINE